MKRLMLKGRHFGPLCVLEFWGYQSSNGAWIYYCRSCGHIGKRLATHLLNHVRTNCPACKRDGGLRVARVKKPTKTELAAWLSLHGPNESQMPKRKLKRVTTRLENWDTESLIALAERVEKILNGRWGAI